MDFPNYPDTPYNLPTYYLRQWVMSVESPRVLARIRVMSADARMVRNGLANLLKGKTRFTDKAAQEEVNLIIYSLLELPLYTIDLDAFLEAYQEGHATPPSTDGYGLEVWEVIYPKKRQVSNSVELREALWAEMWHAFTHNIRSDPYHFGPHSLARNSMEMCLESIDWEVIRKAAAYRAEVE